MPSNTFQNLENRNGLGAPVSPTAGFTGGSASSTTGINPVSVSPVNNMMPVTASPIQSPTVASPAPSPVASPTPAASPYQESPSILSQNGVMPQQSQPSNGVSLNPSSGMSNSMMPMTPMGLGPTIANRTPYGSQMGGATMLMAKGGGVRNRSAGGFDMQKSPHLGIGAGAGSRQLHVGPVVSSVPGRTDHHPVKVPSGSYVIPSDVVSGHGQGNSLAGMNVLGKMFKMGPFGSGSPMGIKGGRGAPPPPKPFKMASGGSTTDANAGIPVPVNIAGGEVVVPPENLMQVVHPDLDTAHKIMDAFVLHSRKALIKQLKSLPGPAQD